MPWSCARCDAAATDARPLCCPSCGSFSSFRPSTRRAVSDALGAAVAARESTAAELLDGNWPLARCPVTGLLLGTPAVVFLHGPPGGGKSTLACQVLLQRRGVLLASLEEQAGPSLCRRVGLAGGSGRRDVRLLYVADVGRMADAARSGAALLIDSISVTTLTADDVRSFASMGSPLVIGVLQETKAGGPRGPLSFSHAADIVLAVEAGRWTCTKSRFGAAGATGEVAHYGEPWSPPSPLRVVVAGAGERILAFGGTS
jgi:predicted ATP-dependent serine protease